MVATRPALVDLLIAIAATPHTVEVRQQRPSISHDTGLRLDAKVVLVE